jgi:putative MATE family efflux protein
MTTGGVARHLIVFAAPLLFGNLLQQMYNAVDTIVVGHNIGKEALAAVGSTGPVIMLLIAFFQGMASGASVLISRYFGAGDSDRLEDAVHTAMLLAVIIGAALSVIGVTFTPTLLRWMKTPDDMIEGARLYLRIYFAGLIGLTVYNMGSGVLQAVGNARFPLFFLIISAGINTAGDLLLIVVFKMGVEGAAYATIFAQAISAVLVCAVLMKSKRGYRLVPKRLRLGKMLTRNITALGLPGAIQGSIVSVSNIMVQKYLNGLGTVAVAGNSAANKLDAFLPLPVQVMALAVTTFVAQNIGAGRVDRARRGVRVSMVIGVGVTAALSAFALIFHDQFLGIFAPPDKDVLAAGWQFMRVYAPFSFVLAWTQVMPGALRGAGDVKVSMFASIGCFVILRQVYLAVMTKTRYTIFTVALGYPATWSLCAAIIMIHYLRTDWSKFAREKQPAAK